MLRLDANPRVRVVHEESRCEFFIRPLDPRTNERLLKEARNDQGEFDPIKYNGLVVDAVVMEWGGVGAAGVEAPTSTENKRALGEKFPAISGFLFRKATDIRLWCDEVETAKNG